MELWELADLCTPWCIHVAATLRVADRIQAGKTHIDELATACAADPDALCRVLRHLVSKGIFEEPETGCFALNETARKFLEEGARLGLNLEGFGGRMAHSWSTLLTAVRTGRAAYQEIFGLPYWDDLAAHPEISAEFDTLMGPAGHGVPDPEVLLDPNDWAGVRTVVDVGGGTGSLLSEVLRARPGVRGILVDLAAPVARSRETFAAAGVADRATGSSQSFFDPLPAGADVYLIKNVLSDWPDREAAAILQRCAEAARPSGRVMILSGVGKGDRVDPDLLMLVLVGGKGRTLAGFGELARGAGLAVTATGRQPSGRFIVECRPL